MNKTKKVLIIAYNDLNKSGVPNVIFQVVKSLYKYCSFDIMVFGNDLYYFDLLQKQGYKNINIIKFGDSFKIRDCYNYYKKALIFFNNNKYDIVHSFLEYKSYPFFKAAKENNINQRIYHSNINKRKDNLVDNFIKSFLRKKSIKYSTDLIGVSKDCCDYMFKKEKCTVINNPYDESIYNKNIKNNLNKNKLVLTQIATYNSNKNQLFSLQIVNEIYKTYKDVTLKLVGRETENGYLSSIKHFIFDNNLKTVIELIDGNSNIGNIYEETTFTLIPSKSEGFSLVAIESQACGITPFLSSNVPHDVDPYGFAHYINSNDPKEWAKEILSLFEKIGNNRFELPIDNPFTKDNFKNKLLALYKI